MRRAVIASLLAALLSPVAAQTPPPPRTPLALFNGRDLTGWKTEHAKARVSDAAIRVSSSRGWVRTERPFADFVLTFEVRMRDAGRAGVFVRGWPVFNEDGTPASGFRLTKAFHEAKTADVRWERWRIECRGAAIRLLIDGVEAYSTQAVKNPQGYVGLWARDGAAEFRDFHVQELDPPKVEIPGVVPVDTPGVAIPRLLKEVKPAYTAAAMQQQIQGAVLMHAIVEEDGSIGDVSLVQSLDPQHGLDAAAIAAAKTWRFMPGTLDGKPVRTVITIELTFTRK